MHSKLIAHVVFNFCGAVDDACYYHEKETRVSFCVNVRYFDSTSCSDERGLVVTRSFRLSLMSVQLLPTMTEAATRLISYAVSQLKEYSSLQENPYNVRYSHTVLIVHIYFAPWGVDNV